MTALRLLVGASAVLAAGEAWACPTCATREPSGMAMVVLVVGMITVPFLITFAAVRAIRRLERRE